MPKPSVLTEPEDDPIPVANDLDIEILTDQMIECGESSQDVLDISAVTVWRQETK